MYDQMPMNPTMLTVQRWTRKSWFIGRAGQRSQMLVSSDPHVHNLFLKPEEPAESTTGLAMSCDESGW